MTDEVKHNTEMARDLMDRAHILSPDPAEKAAALITAATVIIERDVGRALAPGALMALIAPTIADWTDRQPGGTVQ